MSSKFKVGDEVICKNNTMLVDGKLFWENGKRYIIKHMTKCMYADLDSGRYCSYKDNIDSCDKYMYGSTHTDHFMPFRFFICGYNLHSYKIT